MKKYFKKALPKIIGTAINIQSIYNPKKAALRAFLIFSAPRLGRVQENQIPFLETGKDNRLKSEKLDIQGYAWRGKGKTVLLIHGWESNTHRWFKLVEDLQKQDYNIVAIDAPAQGYSSGKILNVPKYAQAIEMAVQNYNPEIIIGHSLGALSVIFHNYTYNPEQVKKFVLLGSASELNEIMIDYKGILGLNDKVMRYLEKLVVDTFGYNFKEFSGAAFAKAIKSPTLIIHDKYDSITPVKASQNIHKNIEHSTYVETEGFGHSLYQDAIRERILEFIA
ncbi:alpha/beta hydrolase [Dokdonia sinensis]|uniref:Alpha/beta hydrolase n=1 Tax=Dokdonia sinensis TaxID=2479847 RepID=A0A3M0G7V8_9FLAO|nr:alpha/beta hydrolase [Dokdonia sinensis]RMB61101.1 alpha/beta hydrolase [Dokdonia sinensis]